MTLELINAIAAGGTLILLAATIFAGIKQLAHMRASNELVAAQAIERDFRLPAIQAALRYVQAELPARIADPRYRAELSAIGYIDPQAHPEMLLCNWFNRTGVLVRDGLLKEELFFDTFGRLVTYYWDLLMPVIAVLRRTRGPSQYAGFEFLAYRARRHMPANAEPAISDAPSA
jgi:hypothetical protein